MQITYVVFCILINPLYISRGRDFLSSSKVLKHWSNRLYADDAGEAVRLCEALLEEPELDPAVRIGDAFGFLIEHHCQQGSFQVVTIIFLVFQLGQMTL